MSRSKRNEPDPRGGAAAPDRAEALEDADLDRAAGGSVIVDFEIRGDRRAPAVQTDPITDPAGRFSPAIDPDDGPKLGN